MRYALHFLFALCVVSGLRTGLVHAGPKRGAAWLRCIEAQVEGAAFLHRRNPNRYRQDPVHPMERVLREAGVPKPTDPANKIAAWLAVMERGRKRVGRDEAFRNRLKASLYDQYVLKPDDAPQAYFELQARLARQTGRWDSGLTAGAKAELVAILIRDQKQSLDAWLDYFISNDTAQYPTWAKVWAFEEMTKLRALNSGELKFTKRSRDTTGMFPELNREALAIVMDGITKRVSVHSTPVDLEYRTLLEKERFAELYAWALKKVAVHKADLSITTGKWVKFPRGSDPTALVQAIDCKGTGWCTVGRSTAEMQLSGGDFYVYFSDTTVGEAKQPRIAIRMEEDQIAEVRGIANDQHLDPEMARTDVLEKKLSEFGSEGEEYKKRSSDMKRLIEIEDKSKAGAELNQAELRFLYEVDGPIEGLGYEKYPGIAEIVNQRDKRADLRKALGVDPSKISLTSDEALRGGMVFHFGNLALNHLQTAEGIKLPIHVSGGLFLSGFKSAQGLTFPSRVGGNLHLGRLKSAEGLTLPSHVGGYLILEDLKSSKGLTMPSHVGKYIKLDSLKSAEGLTLPGYVGGDLELGSLKTAKGLTFPTHLGGGLNLRSLKSARGRILPKYVDADLDLGSIKSAKGLTLPHHVGGDLFLDGLTSTEGLVLKDEISGEVLFSKELFQSSREFMLRHPQYRFEIYEDND